MPVTASPSTANPSTANPSTASPSTAFLAAAARAAHLVVDAEPHVFTDPWAAALLGDQAGELIDYHRRHGAHLVLAGARAQAVIRSRVAEDLLTASGVDQYVILGAGLDSYACRAPDTVTVFEVDHPQAQAAKRRRLADVGVRDDVARFVPVDLQRQRPMPALHAAGLDPGRPAFVSWLGVTMYLTAEAVAATVADLAALPAGSHLVLDFMLPAPWRDEAARTYVDLVAPVTAGRGEPWRSFFTPDEMVAVLARFGPTTTIGQHQVLGEPRADALTPSRLTMVAHAVRAPAA